MAGAAPPWLRKIQELKEERVANRGVFVESGLWIDATASNITVQGARYPEKLEQMTGR